MAAEKTGTRKTLSTTGLPKMRFKHKLILILVSFFMMALMRTGFVFLVIGMLPAIVAYYMDVSKHRYTFKSIFAANLSGMLPYITQIISHHASSSMLQEIMGSSATWIVIYGSACLGWLLVFICPMISQIMVAGVHQAQLARYEWLQKKLESEWGQEVTQFSGDRGREENA